MQLAALLTCHNRRDQTLACLRALHACARPVNCELDVYLVDDGSRDGTGAAVHAEFPLVSVIEGDGSLFWNGGMHQAQARAMEHNADYLLWLNDDTELLPDSIARLLEAERILKTKYGQPVVVVGSTADRETGRLSYGGYVAPQRWRPFTYQRVWHASEPVECHVMNGNLVLIPMQIAQVVGNLDPVFEHAMGDTDYALRARAKGFRVFVAPGFVGHCSNNTASGTYKDTSLSLSVRWKKMMSRKGLPPRSWWHLTRKHGGPAWPVYFVWPYFNLLLARFAALDRAHCGRGDSK